MFYNKKGRHLITDFIIKTKPVKDLLFCNSQQKVNKQEQCRFENYL